MSKTSTIITIAHIDDLFIVTLLLAYVFPVYSHNARTATLPQLRQSRITAETKPPVVGGRFWEAGYVGYFLAAGFLAGAFLAAGLAAVFLAGAAFLATGLAAVFFVVAVGFTPAALA